MMFPLFLNVGNHLALVVGGGPVGRRKAQSLLQAGGRVRLVCLEPRPINEISDRLCWLQEPYRAEHFEGVVLAFAAATAEVNRQVTADAHQRGIWVNVADDPGASDFFMPAVLRRGDLLIAVGTSGAAPALAQEVRDLLETQFDETSQQWVAALAELRPEILEQIPDPNRRRQLFHRLCRWEWLERFRREDATQVKAAMQLEVRQHIDAKPQAM
jgi:precorrin-2 dehydrogenase / sirohydrochlorin ferrochelatase